MTLGDLSVRRAITTTMIYLCVGGFGLFSLSRLPLDRLPDVDFPVVAIITEYVGASPNDVERLVTEPIERAVASVENVENVRSISRQGTSLVMVEFVWGTDMDAAEIHVRKNLELFADEAMPDDVRRPLTFAFDPSLAPVMFMSIDGPLDPHRLRDLARDEIQPYLARVEGVAAAEVVGGLDREIQVRLEPVWLEATGISATQVIEALRAHNVMLPSGSIDDRRQELNIDPSSEFTSVAQIREVIVGMRGGRPVKLGEVAEVVDTFEEETHVITANGKSAVMMAVRKQSDANTVQVARAVREALPEIQRRLPEGIELRPLFDESESILRSIANLGSTAGQAFLLTGLVLLAFLRSWRTSIIPTLSIPIAVVVAFVFMDALDVTLNLISMAGLALAIGMLVDNGIVVLEAIFQHVERGMPARQAAVAGAKEMSMPLVASTLTTVVVFLPILLVEGIAGEIFRDMALTICVTLLASLVVALSLVPLMASRMLRRAGQNRFGEWLRRTTGFLDRLGPLYERSLRAALRHRKKMLAGVGVAFVGAMATTPLLGADFLPRSDRGEIRIEVEAAPGTSVEEMRGLVREVEGVLRETAPEAEVITADFGTAEGFGALFGVSSSVASMRIKLPPLAQRSRTQMEIEDALTDRFRDLPGLDIEVSAFNLGGSGNGDVEVKLFSEDLDQLRDFGNRLENAMDNLEGAENVKLSMDEGRPEISLRLDRERLRSLGVPPAQVAATISTFFQGTVATLYREGGDEFAIRVRAQRDARADIDTLRHVPIAVPAGMTVPLSSVAEITDDLGPTAIERENQRRFASVFATADGVDLGELVARIERVIAELGVPEGVQIAIGGTAEDMRESFQNLALAFLASLILVYMVMASQFESLLEPFVIMFTVPLAAIGVVLALLATGTTLQVTALIGVILLGGVVVNNGIVLVDVLKKRRAEGADLEGAALEAARMRLRPILMTALTTIFGMIPLALGLGDGAETWAPMAITVVGGMTLSTALTLFVVPSLYVVVAGYADRRRARRRGTKPPDVADLRAAAE